MTMQLKYNYPRWKKMKRKFKKELFQQVVDEVLKNYDYSQALNLPIEELTGVEDQTPVGGYLVSYTFSE
jgi:hypothetical protein